MEEQNEKFGSPYGTGAAAGGSTPPPSTSPPGIANTPSFGGTGSAESAGSAGGIGSTPSGGSQGGSGSSGSSGGGGIQDRANQAMDQAAGTLGQAADRLNQFADRQGRSGSGARAKAGQMTHRAAEAMESTARYLRDNDAERLQSDLEGMVRSNPLQTLLVGAAAGWIVGKILR